MKEIKSNVPTCSVSEIVNTVSKLYINAMKNNVPFKKLAALFLWGPPGVGKSEGVYEIGERIEKETGKKVNIVDVRLLLFSPIDLRGIPMADATRQFTEWMRPKLFDFDPSDDVINILFLDELSAAPPSVQAAAYQITLDRRIGEHRLPENTIVIGAGNRVTDRSVAYKMPRALANRLIHFEVALSFDSWRQWALTNGIHPYVLGYLSFDRKKLLSEDDRSDDVAFPTPRSWVFVSDLLKTMPDTPLDVLYPLIGGCVGMGVALEFITWCQSYKDLPPMETFFSGAADFYPKRPDELHALNAALSMYAIENQRVLSDEALDNCCRYVAHFPKDFHTAFYLNLIADAELRLRLMKIKPFTQWLARNKRLAGVMQ